MKLFLREIMMKMFSNKNHKPTLATSTTSSISIIGNVVNRNNIPKFDSLNINNIEAHTDGYNSDRKGAVNKLNNHKFNLKLSVFIIILMYLSSLNIVNCGCRNQKADDCEIICDYRNNSGILKRECELRLIVILPKSNSTDTTLPKVSGLKMENKYLKKHPEENACVIIDNVCLESFISGSLYLNAFKY